MIRMIQEKSRARPAVICDQCKGEITDLSMGMATWPRIEVEGGRSEVFHLHKLDCDQAFKKVVGDTHPWSELRTHLTDLGVQFIVPFQRVGA